MSDQRNDDEPRVIEQPAVRAERPPGGLPKVLPYLTLDAWRGVAALWVVMLHACLSYITNGHDSFLRNPVYLVSTWGQLGVTMFFVISGYCITGAAYHSIATEKPLIVFCRDRLRRIFPPYLVSLLLVASAIRLNGMLQRWNLLPSYRTTHPSLEYDCWFWISNLTLTQVPAGQPSLLIVAWSLCYEVTFYAIIAVFLALGLLYRGSDTAVRLNVLLAGIWSLTSGSLVWLCVSPERCIFPFYMWYQFGLGALLFICLAGDRSGLGTGRRISVWAAAASVFALTALFAALRAVVDSSQRALGHPSSRVQAVFSLAFCALLFGLRAYDAPLSRLRGMKIAARIGVISYSLYLVHTVIMPYIDVAFRRVGFTDGWYLLTYVVEVLSALLAGWLFFSLIERRFISQKQVRRIAAES